MQMREIFIQDSVGRRTKVCLIVLLLLFFLIAVSNILNDAAKKRGDDMANIKSAKKRILVSRKKADRNKAIRSGVRTAIKKVYAAIDAKDKDAAASAVLAATSAIDKATSKGVYHKNYASRKISRLNLAYNKVFC